MNKPQEEDSSSSVLSKALHGDVQAQFELSCLLIEEGQPEVAGGWFKKAALSGHVEAAFRVAMLCLEGDAISRTDAMFWMQKAAAAGHAGAEYQLARMYEMGAGVKMNPDMALRFYRQAAQHGNAEAAEKLAELNLFIEQLPPNIQSKQKRNELA
jgi:TPR repeat protein